ncbi:unnamed protein product [Phaeothamnion confervicola]
MRVLAFLLLMSRSRKAHHEQKVLPYTREQLFAVVSDVSRYHEFVPFCVDSRVLRRLSPHCMEAELAVGFKVFTERYTSRVTFHEPTEVVAQALDSSLFSKLRSSWRFSEGPFPRSSRVDFDVEFEVHNPVAAAAVGSFFRDVTLQQVKAFERRCRQLYGPAASAPSPWRRSNDGRDAEAPAVGANPVSTVQQPLGRRQRLEMVLPFSVSDAVAVLGDLRRVEAVLQAHAVPEPLAVASPPVAAAAAAGAAEGATDAAEGADTVATAALVPILKMEGFEAACRELGEEFSGFRPLAEDPALAAALYSSIKYMLRRRARQFALREQRAAAGGPMAPSGAQPERRDAASEAASIANLDIGGVDTHGDVPISSGSGDDGSNSGDGPWGVGAAGGSNGGSDARHGSTPAVVSSAATYAPTPAPAPATMTGAAAAMASPPVGFSDRGLHLVGRALDDFAVSAYMMAHASPEDRGRFVFHAMDTDENERLDRGEMQRALQTYMAGVGRVIPKLVAHQLERGTGQDQVVSDADRARIVRRSAAVVDQLMAEIMKEIPSAVEQIFLEVQAGGSIGEGDWEAAWQNYPELLDMMSLQGLSKITHWAAMLSEQRSGGRDDAGGGEGEGGGGRGDRSLSGEREHDMAASRGDVNGRRGEESAAEVYDCVAARAVGRRDVG